MQWSTRSSTPDGTSRVTVGQRRWRHHERVCTWVRRCCLGRRVRRGRGCECEDSWCECEDSWCKCEDPWCKCEDPWCECEDPWCECEDPWCECEDPWCR